MRCSRRGTLFGEPGEIPAGFQPDFDENLSRFRAESGEFSSGTAAKTRENHGIEKRLRKRGDRLIRRTQTNLCDRLFSKMSAVPNHVIDDSFLHLLPNGTFLLIGTILAYQKRVGKRILWIILRKSSQEQEHSAINLENVRKVFLF